MRDALHAVFEEEGWDKLRWESLQHYARDDNQLWQILYQRLKESVQAKCKRSTLMF